jgi:hypothetical protein
MTTFQYGSLAVKDLGVDAQTHPKTGKKFVRSVLLNGEPLTPTQRFWTSLQVYYRFSDNIFNYFTHEEVFGRISERFPDDRMRYCVERDGDRASLLAVTGLNKAVIRHDDLMEVLRRYEADKVAYSNGVVSSTHRPPRGGGRFDIQGDVFERRFVMDSPVDGFGRPNIYLSLLRQVCTNGMVGYARAFRTELRVGRGADDVRYAVVRALDNFGNDEGFAALRQRFESAAESWASVAECNRLYRDLLRLHASKNMKADRGEGRRDAKVLAERERSGPVLGGDGAAHSDFVGSWVLKRYHEMTGDLVRLYGVTQLDALSIKRQRTLPARCMVYDLLNFATEVATHHATEIGSRALQAFTGTLISQEYDMEGTAVESKDFNDFFLKR